MPISLFEVNLYRSANPDLSGLSDEQAWSHFKNYGLENGLEFSSLVDLDFYRASNSDLADLTNRQAYENLVNYGVSQGRKFSAFVDLEFYKENNGDLANLSNEELFDHLKNQGIKEGRSFSPFFDVKYYLADNPDVAQVFGSNYREAFNNFVIKGLNDGDSFSPAFDVEFYKNAYDDLAASSLSHKELLEHFIITGLGEGRASAPGFDVKYYLENNPALEQAGFSYSDAYEHFVTTGLREGLAASEFIENDDYAGNTLDSARRIALDSSEIIFRDSIGNSDSEDFYSFNLDNPNSNLKVEINGLSADGDLELLNNSGEIIARAANSGNIGESLNINNLENGAYYVRILQGVESGDTNYNLSLSVIPIDTESETIVLSESPPIAATATSPIPQSASSTSNVDPITKEVVGLINEYRADHGLQPLSLNINLSNAALGHSKDMADNDFFSHIGSGDTTAGDRAKEAGYSEIYSLYVAENIAAGHTTPEEVFNGWINSPSHNENILNPFYTETGVGYYHLENDTGIINYNRYWTQNFGFS